jgi:heat shock protein HslJ/uncharacterized lipoprotein YbaY
MSRVRLLAGVFGLSLLAACAGSPLSPDRLTVAGELTASERVALSPDSRAIVELRVDNDAGATVAAEQRIDLQGRQLPIPFAVEVETRTLKPGERYAVRGGISHGGRMGWVSDPVIVRTDGLRVEVGALALRPVQPLAFSTAFNCGGYRAVVGFSGHTMQLAIHGRTYEMKQVTAASGARYEAVDEVSTAFWSKGDRATLTLRGRDYPECIEAKVVLPLRATGNEPSWRLDIATEAMTLTTDFGGRRESTTAPVRSRHDDLTRFSGRLGPGELVATVGDRLCRDSMSGMPHPYTVTVRVGGRVLHGCGGEPRTLLTGREWVVEDLDHSGIIDRSRLTLVFDADGRVSGRGGCNTFTGRYVLSGEALTIHEAVFTQKACVSALMAQEARFIGLLREVSGFDINGEGALVLLAGARRALLARL